jgi:hypothetical protein
MNSTSILNKANPAVTATFESFNNIPSNTAPANPMFKLKEHGPTTLLFETPLLPTPPKAADVDGKHLLPTASSTPTPSADVAGNGLLATSTPTPSADSVGAVTANLQIISDDELGSTDVEGAGVQNLLPTDSVRPTASADVAGNGLLATAKSASTSTTTPSADSVGTVTANLQIISDDDSWFANVNYGHGISASASDHALSFSLGHAF